MYEVGQILKAPVRVPMMAFEVARQIPMTAAALVLGAAIPGVIARKNDEIAKQTNEQRQKVADQYVAFALMGREDQANVIPFPPSANRVRAFADDSKRPFATHGKLIDRVMKGVHELA